VPCVTLLIKALTEKNPRRPIKDKMDILAHFLWTFGIFFKSKDRVKAGLMGIMPDLLSFGPHMIMSLIFGTIAFGKPDINSIPNSVFVFYSITHSLIIFSLVMLLIYFFTKRVYWFVFGWLIHILIDIPSHSKEFFPTPFLWPLSDFTFNGISWGTPWFMIINYSTLVIVYSWLIFSTKGLNELFFLKRKPRKRKY